MVKAIFSFILFSFFLVGNSQQMFQKKIGNFDGSRIYSVENTLDSGYVFLGSYDVAGFNTAEFYVIKVDKFGDTVLANTFGSLIDSTAVSRDGAGNEGYDVIQSKDSGYLLLGEAHGFNGTGSSDVYCIKIDKNGDYQWSKTYGGALGSDYGFKAFQLQDAGYFFIGYTESYGLGNRDVYVIRTNSIGDTLFTKYYGSSGIDACLDGVLLQDGSFVMVGYTFSSGGADAHVMKIDSLGAVIWEFTYGGIDDDYANGIVKTTDNSFIVTGLSRSFGAGQQDVLAFKIDSIGGLIWNKTYGGTNNEIGKSIVSTSDGNYVITGNTRSFGQGAEDVFLMKINSLGDTIWSYTYGGISIDLAEEVEETLDKGFIIGAYTNSFMTFNFDAYLIKLDSMGNSNCTQRDLYFTIDTNSLIVNSTSYASGSGAIVKNPTTLQGNTRITVENPCLLTSVEEIAENKSLVLYPNPTSDKVFIEVPDNLMNETSTILVRDLSGKIIELPISNTNSLLEIEVSQLPRGLYTIQYISQDQILTSRFVKI